MRTRALAMGLCLSLLISPAVATTSITPKAQGSVGWSMDFALDSVTNNIRQMSTLFDPATGLLISPLASGGPVIANAGNNLNTSLLALESGGNLASLVAQIGSVMASPPANTMMDRLKTINTTLGTPMQQTGGSVTIAGTLPAYAATPTFNFGTLNGAATAANQTAVFATGQNGASPASEILVGGQFNTTPGTIASGNSSPLQLDNAGNLLVNIKAGSAAGGTSSNFASAFPGSGTAIGVKNGANMVNLNADGSGNLFVNCTVGCQGGTTSNALSAVATSATNGATVAWLYGFNGTTWDQAQMDGSKNLKVNVSTGTVTANAGTNLNTSLLALESGGNIASLVTQIGAVSASPAANTVMDRLKSILAKQPALGTAGTPSPDLISVQGASGGFPIPFSSSAIADTVGTLAALGALNNTASVALNGQEGAGMLLAAGNLIGTLTPEVSYDGGVSWVATQFYDPTAQAMAQTLVFGSANTVTTRSIVTSSGASHARVRVSAYTSGSANAALRATSVVTGFSGVPQGSTTLGQPGTLSQGAVTTASPVYTTGQTFPLSMTTAGALRADISGTTSPISAVSLPLPAGASTAALQPTNAAQGSTTAGQTGTLMQGAVTSAAPSYTNAQTSPFSLDMSGNLRVNVTTGGVSGNVSQGSTTSGNTGPMAQGAVTTAAPTYTTGQTNPLSLDTAGNLRTTVTNGITGGTVGSAPPAGANDPMMGVLDSSGNVANLKLAGAQGSGAKVTGDASTAGGTSTYAAAGGTGNALLSTTVTAVKASAGNLYGVSFDNSAGTQKVYVQFFDVAAGSVTLGTTVPKFSLVVPAGGYRDNDFGPEEKVTFATAISVAATTTATGLTAPTTGLGANFYFK
jgi:hypothetical protein